MLTETSSIIIPDKLLKKLSKQEIWRSNVINVIHNVENIFSREPYFFEEYTDHGILHIKHILDISDKLIPKITLEVITAKTLGIYLISAILHDIGMYITYDNLKEIIESDTIKIDTLDEYSIKNLWKKYLSELKRYSDKDLIRKFGTIDIQFTSLPKSHNNITTTDKLVIGEFIRQNHHKISHYLINNMIQLGNTDLLKNVNIDKNERDLIGLIARSHGDNLRNRNFENYLRQTYYPYEKPNNVEIFYIISLLRLADYLDAGEERASHIIDEMYVKHSEISQEEFTWNQYINYKSYMWPDNNSQTVIISAYPKSGYYFSKITKWLEAVQRELDLCWAIIGEFYDINEFKFSIRRIDSNLFKESVIKNFEKKFYPKEVHFETDPDIIKLLIQPLYGDNPSYGVRELVQNAVDACREMEQIKKSEGKTYSGKIKVHIDTKSKSFTIEDNGIGMTADTIVNYYLKAGSSYRRSDDWCNNFLDDDGKSKVLRNGKFGIGVLATFLLGAEATITTKNINDDKGWEFTIKLDQDNIEIKRVEKTECGTVVSINLSDETINKLLKKSEYDVKWYNWYVDSTPDIEYKIDGEEKTRNIFDPIKNGWYKLEQNEYDNYYWAYCKLDTFRNDIAFSVFSDNITFCNGIVIPHAISNFENNHKIIFNMPDIYIQDNKGILPVDLSRSLITEIPCHDTLIAECFKYYLAQILKLTFDNDTPKKIPFFFQTNEFFNYCSNQLSLIYSQNGFYPIFKPFRKYINITNYKLCCFEENRIIELDTLKKCSNVIMDNDFFVNFFKHNFEDILFEMSSNTMISHIFVNNQPNNYGNNVSECFFINFEIIKIREKLKNFSEDFPLKLENLKFEDKGNYFLITREDDTNNYKPDFDPDIFPLVIQYNEEYPKNEDEENDIMMKVLKEYFPPNTFIPYDMDERKEVFSEAFEKLEKYM